MTDPHAKTDSDPFVGSWELDPSSPDGLLFTLDGEDADGKALSFTYGGPLDGIDRESSSRAIPRSSSRSSPSTRTALRRAIAVCIDACREKHAEALRHLESHRAKE